jgi:hypothetical protein
MECGAELFTTQLIDMISIEVKSKAVHIQYIFTRVLISSGKEF